MSDIQKRLWRGNGFSVDEWQTIEIHDGLQDGDLIVPLAVLQQAGETLLSRKSGRTGVRLEAGDDIAMLEPYLDRLALVALDFPAFTDGRAYSKAVRLRQNHGFTGEIRAVGDVLLDQLAFMQRCGFDALEISHDATLERLAENRIMSVDRHYQPALDDAPQNPTYSWRRNAVSAG
jgi:uncharacterized protein (DUF934 family)